MVGNKRLHPKVRIIAAGNLATSNAYVNSMSTALQSRMAHFEITVNVPDWISWAQENKIDSRLISFIGYRGELLHKFDPKHNDFTFSCPRTVEMLSKVIKGEEFTNDLIPLIDGIVGKGFSTEFRTYLAYFSRLPTLAQILDKPLFTDIPEGAGMCYALSSMLIESITSKNANALMEYILRLNVEFQAMILISAYKANPSLDECTEVEKWVDVNYKKYL